jgi:hypothetical protein
LSTPQTDPAFGAAQMNAGPEIKIAPFVPLIT